jgi:transmembrane E3 ubiquitin-protein ligase
MTAGFLTFIGSMVFGARFIYTIYQVQRPPRGSSTTPAPRAAPTTLPAPVTAPNQTPAPAPAGTSIFSSIYPTSPANQPPRPPTPIIIAPDQDAPLEQEADQAATAQQQGGTTTPESDGRQDALLLLSRSLLALFTTSFLFLHATSWSYPYRTYFFRFTVTVLSSIWWPQVYRNVSRNARVGLSMRFVLGQSVARVGTFAGAMVLLGSVRGDGIAGTNWGIVLWVVCWVGLQILVLWSQGILGGRWFLPSVVEKWGWLKGGFDYHCVLRKEDLELLGGVENVEDGAETGSVRSGHRRKEGGRCWFDCAICREPVGVPFLDDEDDFSDEERPRDEEEGGASDSLLGSSSSSSSSASRVRRGRGWRRWFRLFTRRGRKRDDNGGSTGGGGGVKERLGLQRKDYMVTPCRHVFHTDCLEGWMRYRLQCPICRCALPAL